MKTVKTITATIYCGFKERDTGVIHTMSEAESICQRYVDDVGLCVTLLETLFVYTKGKEPGCVVGLINYPRFPSDRGEIYYHARTLANLMMESFRQSRVSIVMGDKTMMLQSELDEEVR